MTLPNPITPGVYLTRDSSNAKVYAVLPVDSNEWPVFGQIERPNTVDNHVWMINGKWSKKHTPHDFDLIERIGDLPDTAPKPAVDLGQRARIAEAVYSALLGAVYQQVMSAGSDDPARLAKAMEAQAPFAVELADALIAALAKEAEK